jgi:tRNA(Ile)-lysidine synthase
MLAFSRDEILAAARAWQLEWIEDPSNENLRFDRNYLRARVVPAISGRWPSARRSVAQAARQMADAEEILQAVARADAEVVERGGRIERAALASLSAARQRNVLRRLIAERSLPVPNARQLEGLRSAVAASRPDARTRLRWPGAEARLYRDHLYVLPPLDERSVAGYRGHVSPDRPWRGPEGTVTLERTARRGLPHAWVAEGIELAFRQGGERFRAAVPGPRRRLKRWLQEAAVLPWMRDRIPLLYHDGQLVAIGDLWLMPVTQTEAWCVCWTDHPPVQ